MAIIKGSTKRGQALLARASRNEGTELFEIYGSYSAAKGRAMRDCKEKCNAVDGYNFRIISHNGWAFSVAWNFVNEETGEIMTQIETSSGTYVIDGSRVEPEISKIEYAVTVYNIETDTFVEQIDVFDQFERAQSFIKEELVTGKRALVDFDTEYVVITEICYDTRGEEIYRTDYNY